MHNPQVKAGFLRKSAIKAHELCQKPLFRFIISPLISTIPLAILILFLKDNPNNGIQIFNFDFGNFWTKAGLLALFLFWIAFLKYLCAKISSFAQSQEIDSEVYLLALLEVLDKVVTEKVDRFSEVLENASRSTGRQVNAENIFESITQPDKQIKYLVTAILGVFQHIIPGKEVRVSLLGVKNKQPSDWVYWAPKHSGTPSSINVVKQEYSTARKCIETNSMIVIENTEKEYKKGKTRRYAPYTLPKVEKHSILCYPVCCGISREISYVISVEVLKEDSLKENLSEIYSYVLQKIVTRIELEVNLMQLKEKVKHNGKSSEETSKTRS